jgi:hypothetical protein
MDKLLQSLLLKKLNQRSSPVRTDTKDKDKTNKVKSNDNLFMEPVIQCYSLRQNNQQTFNLSASSLTPTVTSNPQQNQKNFINSYLANNLLRSNQKHNNGNKLVRSVSFCLFLFLV